MGDVTTAAASVTGWVVVVVAAAREVDLVGSNSRRAEAANAQSACVVAGVRGELPTPVAAAVARATTRDGLTVAVAAGAGVPEAAAAGCAVVAPLLPDFDEEDVPEPDVRWAVVDGRWDVCFD